MRTKPQPLLACYGGWLSALAPPVPPSLALIQDSKNACQVEKEAYEAPEGKSKGLRPLQLCSPGSALILWRLVVFLSAAQAPKDEAEVQVGGLVSGSHQRALPPPKQQLQPEHACLSMTPSPNKLVMGLSHVTERLLHTYGSSSIMLHTTAAVLANSISGGVGVATAGAWVLTDSTSLGFMVCSGAAGLSAAASSSSSTAAR